jgi:hypothetical protein
MNRTESTRRGEGGGERLKEGGQLEPALFEFCGDRLKLGATFSILLQLLLGLHILPIHEQFFVVSSPRKSRKITGEMKQTERNTSNTQITGNKRKSQHFPTF